MRSHDPEGLKQEMWALLALPARGGQKIHAGLARARTTASATIGASTCQIPVEPGITVTGPRTTSRQIRRHQAAGYQPGLP